MKKQIQDLYDELSSDLQRAYEESITITEAEKLAAKFLHAQLTLANELAILDLDARMRKSGLKAVKGAIYMEVATKDAKKPSDTLIEQVVNLNELVQGEQESFDKAEIVAEQLRNYLNVFKDGHIYFRGLAKGAYSG